MHVRMATAPGGEHPPLGAVLSNRYHQVMQLSEHFSDTEFRCPDCGRVKVDPGLIARLEMLRAKLGVPIRITSGYRCPEHNAQVDGAAKDSQHLTGRAADVAADVPYLVLLAACLEIFHDGGVGKYPKDGHVHVDIRGYTARW